MSYPKQPGQDEMAHRALAVRSLEQARRIEELEREVERLHEQGEDFVREIIALRAEVERLTKCWRDSRRALSRSKGSEYPQIIEDLRAEVERLKERIGTLQAGVRFEVENVQELERKLAKAEEALTKPMREPRPHVHPCREHYGAAFRGEEGKT